MQIMREGFDCLCNFITLHPTMPASQLDLHGYGKVTSGSLSIVHNVIQYYVLPSAKTIRITIAVTSKNDS